jgi:hypothetical protein
MNNKKLIRNGVSAVTFGVCYAFISYLFDRTVDVAEIVVSIAAYFIIMGLLNLILSKLRK